MLDLKVEWEAAPGVGCPVLQSTWGRIEITVAEQTVTRYLSARSNGVRSATYGSAFPLARWLIENWWNLLHEGLKEPALLEGPRVLESWPNEMKRAWHERHSLLFAREGMAYPDLSVFRAEADVCLTWRADPDAGAAGGVLGSGLVQAPLADVSNGLAKFVDTVLARLSDQGVDHPYHADLREAWTVIVNSTKDREEALLSQRLAALGLDPYDPEADTEVEATVAALAFEPGVLEDLLAVSKPDGLKPNSADAAALTSKLPVPILPDSGRRFSDPATGSFRPFRVGYERAAFVRKELSLGFDPLEDMNQVVKDSAGQVSVAFCETAGNDIDAAVQTHPNGRALVGRDFGRPRARFLLARALHHWLFTDGAERRLLTRGHDWQQAASRAFAAELLAPARGIEKRAGGGLDANELADLYGVDPFVIAHQLENHGLAS